MTQQSVAPGITGKWAIAFVGTWTAFAFGLEIPGWETAVAMMSLLMAASVTITFLPGAIKGFTG
jgi:hypothetical protein